MDEAKTTTIHWNDQLEEIISQEGERALCFSWLHSQCEKQYSAYHSYISLPTIIFSTLAGSASIGSQSIFENTQMANMLIGSVSISVAVLNTVSSFFGWAKRAEAHRLCGINYTKIHRFIMIELALPRDERMNAKDMLKVVRDQSDRLQETSPQISDAIIRRFKKLFGESTPELSKPTITNGLDPIFVYKGESVRTPLV